MNKRSNVIYVGAIKKFCSPESFNSSVEETFDMTRECIINTCFSHSHPFMKKWIKQQLWAEAKLFKTNFSFGCMWLDMRWRMSVEQEVSFIQTLLVAIYAIGRVNERLSSLRLSIQWNVQSLSGKISITSQLCCISRRLAWSCLFNEFSIEGKLTKYFHWQKGFSVSVIRCI